MTSLAVRAVETAEMTTQDGVRLDADIYRPEAAGPWPVLLLRQAYGRRVAATVCYAHPRWYAAQGYVVVVQDVRGRGTSGGRFDTLQHEAMDGAETVDWCANLAGTTGEVGMYGFSYQGMNQLLAAATAGPALKVLAPAMIGWNLYQDTVREGGALLLAGTVGWAAQLGADTARHLGDRDAYDALRAAATRLPLDGPITAQPEVMRRWADYHHYERWTQAEEGDPLWCNIAPAAHRDAIFSRQIPMLFIGGWYDFTLPGTLAAWREAHAVVPHKTRLLIGPWAHMPWGSLVGGTDFGEDAVSKVDLIQISWFDRWLKGTDNTSASVRLFDLGAHHWREAADLRHVERRLFLGSDGRASIDPGAGWLRDQCEQAGEDAVVHDPWRPVPTCGGRWGSPSGPVERGEIDQRGDVLTFTSAPLARSITIFGAVRAVLYVEADMPSFDLVCTASRVSAEGRVVGFAEGVRRATGDKTITAVDVDMFAVCITLAVGERLRLSVALASFPAYSVNPGIGDPIQTPFMDAQVITLVIRHGGDHPSALIIDIADPNG